MTTATPELVDVETALARKEDAAVASPLPVFRGAEMVEAIKAYRELQKALDQSMPDQIMELDGKAFRKKGYWRALSVAFNLTVEPIEERRATAGVFLVDGRENFGYCVTYRATAGNGRSATGDGSCFAVEKARRFRCPHPERPGSKRTLHFPAEACPDFDPDYQWRTLPAQATEHNIRSHAHTRAFNRAVSNLVGFGEVSAEEVERGETPLPTQTRSFQRPPQEPPTVATDAPTPEPTADPDTTRSYVRGYITDVVETKKGKTATGKPYVKSTVKIAPNDEDTPALSITTFHGHEAEALMNAQALVDAYYKVSPKWGPEMVSLNAVPNEDDGPLPF